MENPKLNLPQDALTAPVATTARLEDDTGPEEMWYKVTHTVMARAMSAIQMGKEHVTDAVIYQEKQGDTRQRRMLVKALEQERDAMCDSLGELQKIYL